MLQKAGVEGAFTALLDIGMVAEESSTAGGEGASVSGGWKPSPASYAYAARRLGLPPGEVCERELALAGGEGASS